MQISATRTLLIAFLALTSQMATGQFFSRAQHAGGKKGDLALMSVVDQYDNIYVLGSFTDTADLDPGPGVAQFYSIHFVPCISKYNGRGELLWVKVIAGSWYVGGTDLAVDSAGYVYVTGSVQNSADMDPGPGIDSLRAGEEPVMYLLKLDPRGNLVWYRSFDAFSNSGILLELDTTGTLIMTGDFRDSIDFDPGPGTHILHSDTTTLFILRLSVTGEFVSVQTLQSAHGAAIEDIALDREGNLYITGYYNQGLAIETDTGLYILPDDEGGKIFFGKINAEGELTWVKSIGGPDYEGVNAIAVDHQQNVFLTGFCKANTDFDPGPGIKTEISHGISDIFVACYSPTGNYRWVQTIGGEYPDQGIDIVTDAAGNVYYTAGFDRTIDLNPDAGVQQVTSAGDYDAIISKLDPGGNFLWAFTYGGPGGDAARGITLDHRDKIIITGSFYDTIDADPGLTSALYTSHGLYDYFIATYAQQGISGKVIFDRNDNCAQEETETGLWGQRGILSPIDIVVETNPDGNWYVDSLPVGDYTIQFDTTDHWTPACETGLHFTVTNPYQLEVPAYSMKSSKACPLPQVSVIMPAMRPCFDHQAIHVNVCNLENATGALAAGMIALTVDSLLTIQSVDVPHTLQDSHTVRVAFDTLYPGECFAFQAFAKVRCGTDLGTTLCLEARLTNVDSCVYDPPQIVFGPDLPVCAYIEDHSHLAMTGWCDSDSVFFLVENTAVPGHGDMQCKTPARVFIDGQLIRVDSIQLQGGESKLFTYPGDGRTWRMEADQSIYHAGHSNPSASIEACGQVLNWTPGLVNVFPPDDDELIADIFCGEVRGSYDPNDKQGFPKGVGGEFFIAPDSRLEYVIRFQNTGTDTAFRVIIRDTLSAALDVLSVVPMSTSHPGSFRQYGEHVLEWVFENILLPDSNTHEQASHGFVSYSVQMMPGLSDGTMITNTASIYFDYNLPVMTNATRHTIHRDINRPSWEVIDTVNLQGCRVVQYDGYIYENSGEYYAVPAGNQPDTLFTLDIRIIADELDLSVALEGDVLTSSATDVQYQWIRCSDGAVIAGATHNTFTPSLSGSYAVILSKEGCSDTSACTEVIISAIADHGREQLVSIHPNPTTGDVTVSMMHATGQIQIVVTDALGNPVLAQSYHAQDDITIPLPANTGMYIVTMTNAARRVVTKVMRT